MTPISDDHIASTSTSALHSSVCLGDDQPGSSAKRAKIPWRGNLRRRSKRASASRQSPHRKATRNAADGAATSIRRYQETTAEKTARNAAKAAATSIRRSQESSTPCSRRHCNFCCKGVGKFKSAQGDGKVQLPPFQELPAPLKALLEGSSPDSKHFLAKTRRYNCAFQMTSFGGNAFREVGWNPTFKVQGQVYHRIGSLLPETATDSAILQIYYNQRADTRMGIIPENDTGQDNHPRRDIIMSLQQMLHETKSYVRSFKYALENYTSSDFIIVIDAGKRPQGEHERRYNAPANNAPVTYFKKRNDTFFFFLNCDWVINRCRSDVTNRRQRLESAHVCFSFVRIKFECSHSHASIVNIMSRRRPRSDSFSDDEDTRTRKRRRTTENLDIEVRLESLITRVGERSTSSLESNLEGLASVLETDLPNYKHKILKILCDCVIRLPEKQTVYTTLVGLLNAKNYNCGGEFVELLVRNLKEVLKIGAFEYARSMVRFLSDLVNCHVIVAGSLLSMFDNFVEVTLEENIPQVRSDFYVHVVLAALPWVGRELYEKKETELDKLLATIESYLRSH
ncbi:NCBP1 [Acanthosepion pharaonis]|uniref:NCBP1 n=1 Tax=Acanthosepion pharaonis TaxID=158019 RepID=A0A812APB0_ACAPH|nr:NCBP1 [Sepia pharaonis]